VIVVDASCLYEVLVDAPNAEPIRERLRADPDHAAPHVIDIEVFSLVRRDHRAATLDATLITLDGRLARAEGPRCRIERIG